MEADSFARGERLVVHVPAHYTKLEDAQQHAPVSFARVHDTPPLLSRDAISALPPFDKVPPHHISMLKFVSLTLQGRVDVKKDDPFKSSWYSHVRLPPSRKEVAKAAPPIVQPESKKSEGLSSAPVVTDSPSSAVSVTPPYFIMASLSILISAI